MILSVILDSVVNDAFLVHILRHGLPNPFGNGMNEEITGNTRDSIRLEFQTQTDD